MLQALEDKKNPYRSHQLARAAKDRLLNSPYATLQQVSCHCDGPHLILRGRLPSFYYKQLAQEVVGKVYDGLQVINETEVIQVTPR